MKQFFKPALLAGLSLAATAALTATPAAAQVNGIATSSPEAAMVQSQALQTGYNTINTTYAAQRTQIQTLQTEVNNLQVSLDTNGDREVNQAEWDANPGVTAQIEAKQQQLQTALTPIALAEYYVVEQLLTNYAAAQNQVITANNIQMMLDPQVFQYRTEGVDVTQKIVAALNQLVPTVVATPPAGYQPRRETVATHQAIQQIIGGLARRAAAQAQQQQAQQPAQQQPSGR